MIVYSTFTPAQVLLGTETCAIEVAELFVSAFALLIITSASAAVFCVVPVDPAGTRWTRRLPPPPVPVPGPGRIRASAPAMFVSVPPREDAESQCVIDAGEAAGTPQALKFDVPPDDGLKYPSPVMPRPVVVLLRMVSALPLPDS